MLDAIVVPHEPTGRDDPFAWLGFTGYWGEFRRSEWSGPTGPNAKTSWTQPITWASRVRDTSITVPDFEGLGESPIHIFCGIVSVGSRALVALTLTPVIGLGALALVLAAVGWIVSYSNRTIRAAYSYYRRYLRTFAIIGAVLIPTGYVVATLQTLIFHVPPVEPFIQVMERFPGIRILLALAIGSLQGALAVLFVTPTVIWTMSQIRSGRTPGVMTAYRHGVRAIWPIFVARVRVGVRIVLYAITIVGIPWAILRLIRAVFIAQAVVQDRDDPSTALADSARTASVNLGRTALTQIVLGVITLITGPLIAILLLLIIPSRPLGLVNYVSSLLFALLFPIGAIGMTLLYDELRGETLAKSVAGD